MLDALKILKPETVTSTSKSEGRAGAGRASCAAARSTERAGIDGVVAAKAHDGQPVIGSFGIVDRHDFLAKVFTGDRPVVRQMRVS